MLGFYSLKRSTKEKKTFRIRRRKRKESQRIHLKEKGLDFFKLIIITKKNIKTSRLWKIESEHAINNLMLMIHDKGNNDA